MKREKVPVSLTYTEELELLLKQQDSAVMRLQRELDMEAAGEQVRARAIAMKRSDELSEAARLLFKIVESFGIVSGTYGYAIWDNDRKACTNWLSNGGVALSSFNTPNSKGVFLRCLEAAQRGEALYVEEMDQGAVEDYYGYISSLPGTSEKLKEIPASGYALPGFHVLHAAFFSQGYLLFITCEPVPGMWDLFIRFARVFELTYTRFLDLQKAEALAREAQIEAALEKVRNRSLAMHHTSELQDVVNIVAQQLLLMKFDFDGGVFIVINDEVVDDIPFWAAAGAADYIQKATLPFIDSPVFTRMVAAIRNREPFLRERYTRDEKDIFLRHMFGYHPWDKLSEARKKELFAREGGLCRSVSISRFTSIGMTNQHGREFSETENKVLQRFGNVLEQSYTRFLDLQKAESQAREARIEASMERVRSRTMAMQSSRELGEVAVLLYNEMMSLDLTQQFFECGYVEVDEVYQIQRSWMTNSDGRFLEPFNFPLTGEPAFDERYAAWKQSVSVFYRVLSGDQLKRHIEFAIPVMGNKEAEIASTQIPDTCHFYCGNFTHGYLIIVTGKPMGVEAESLLARFTHVFEMTYNRFLDLQKAEAQTREARIEAALERTRTQSILMQYSHQLDDALRVFHEQILSLGIQSAFSFLWLPDEENDRHIFWAVWAENQPTGRVGESNATMYKSKAINYPLDRNEPATAQCLVDWKGKEPVVSYHVPPAGVENYFAAWQELIAGVEKLKPEYFSNGLYYVEAYMKYGCFGVMVESELPEEQKKVLSRFAIEFERTYTRFLDLKKAEAQAREAQIEAALERVRSRTMAMQRSDELKDAAVLLFQQVQMLGVHPFACGFNIWDEDRKAATAWMSRGTSLQVPFKYPTSEDVFVHILEAAEKGEFLYVKEQSGEELDTHYRFMATIPVFREMMEQMAQVGLSVPSFQIIHCAFFSQGFLMFITYEPAPYAYDIFKRFAKVFEQTYTRFLDLQKSEAQAVEAIKRASVDRVRAEIASMRSTSDLERITPLIWNELKTLGVPFIRCGVFIMDEEQQQVNTYLSNPEGEAIAAFHQPYNTPGEIAGVVQSWRKKEMYNRHWDEARFIAFTNDLVQQGAITSGEKYLTENRPTDLYLHFLPFLQGMLYVGNTALLSSADLNLVQNLADAFSTAYARYEDFNKLETAKGQVDRALTELKQTQAQLVQTEKMASLGELTAGIAHEIQNPLNFVNNFSEINQELIGELREEIDRGKMQEAGMIAESIRENEAKISLHGKRADAIVKGMLQHSRSAAGQVEETELNALCEEYLRLAFHGYRAKENTLSVALETDFDPGIGKVSVITQDIGRVLLNLYNNAFYAVSKKEKTAAMGYEPRVSVLTRKHPGYIEIVVRDNGMGIPEKIREKIFQPFFTTKPTGQGTGLGLSLSYDIVKAHGGELKLVTKENEGAEFVILLPVTS